jgi:hypothetical protein
MSLIKTSLVRITLTVAIKNQCHLYKTILDIMSLHQNIPNALDKGRYVEGTLCTMRTNELWVVKYWHQRDPHRCRATRFLILYSMFAGMQGLSHRNPSVVVINIFRRIPVPLICLKKNIFVRYRTKCTVLMQKYRKNCF